jgi:hypothetical protein
VEIYLHENKVLVTWADKGPVWVLSPDGTVSEQLRVQGELVWANGERGFSSGYSVGHSEGYEQACRDADKPAAVAS